MSPSMERLVATVGLGLMMAGILLLVFGAAGYAQSITDLQRQDLQRQLDRLQLELDRVGAAIQRIDQENERVRRGGFERLAAVEREMELNRRLIYGMALPLVGQVVMSILTWRRINGRGGTR